MSLKLKVGLALFLALWLMVMVFAYTNIAGSWINPGESNHVAGVIIVDNPHYEYVLFWSCSLFQVDGILSSDEHDFGDDDCPGDEDFDLGVVWVVATKLASGPHEIHSGQDGGSYVHATPSDTSSVRIRNVADTFAVGFVLVFASIVWTALGVLAILVIQEAEREENRKSEERAQKREERKKKKKKQK